MKMEDEDAKNQQLITEQVKYQKQSEQEQAIQDEYGIMSFGFDSAHQMICARSMLEMAAVMEIVRQAPPKSCDEAYIKKHTAQRGGFNERAVGYIKLAALRYSFAYCEPNGEWKLTIAGESYLERIKNGMEGLIINLPTKQNTKSVKQKGV